jgi:hypothetical protein
MTDVVVAGVGMATLGGITARQTLHAVLGEGATPPPTPFRKVTVHPDDDVHVHVLYCPWLGAWAAIQDRLSSLAMLAADEALQIPTLDGTQRFSGTLGLVVVLPTARDDLCAADLAVVTSSLSDELGPRTVATFEGDAGLFPALHAADDLLASRACDAVVLVAADSLVTLAQARQRVAAPPSFWRPAEPLPSEAGAALLLMRAADARANRVAMATIRSSETRVGTSNEANEEIVDGLPMTALLSAVRTLGPFRQVFGQETSSPLRRHEWAMGLARNLGVLEDGAPITNLEDTLGRIGAAAAPASLAVAVLAAWEGALEPPGPALVWAVGDDGTRGLCSVTLTSVQGTPLEPRVPFVGGDRLRVYRLEAPRWETRLLRPSWDPPQVDESETMVRMDPAVGAPVPLKRELEQWVFPLLDDVRVLGRDRSRRRYADSRDTEARIVRRLHRLMAAGTPGTPVVQSWWQGQLEGKDPWRSWAISLVLGTFEGGFGALAGWLALLPENAREDAHLAGEAIALLPPGAPSSHDLQRMMAHAHPVVRAAAFVATARREGLGWDRFEEIATRAECLTLVDAALREAATIPQRPTAAASELLRRWVGSLDSRLAWSASRSALVHGDRAPYEWLVSGDTAHGTRPPLADVLGERRFDVIALVGRHGDSGVLRKWLRSTRPTAGVLDALARFGNVEVWAYLTGLLTDEDLRVEAACSLELLFGRRVSGPERHDPEAWRGAIERLNLDPRHRTRLGTPFSPAHFEREVRLGLVSRAGLEERQAELCARHTRLPYRALHATSAEVEAILSDAAQTWRRLGNDTAGRWV